MAGFRQVVKHVSLLLSQSHDNGQDPLDKSAAVFTLSTETASAPDHTPAQSPLCGVVGRFQTFLIHESPQSPLHFENILASSAGDHVFHEGSDVQPGTDFLADRLHGGLEIYSGKGSIAHTMPPGERSASAAREAPAERVG